MFHELLFEWMPLLMFLTLLSLIFSGYPVGFVLGGVSVLFAAIGIAMGEVTPDNLNLLFERTFSIMSNQVLLAVPLFVFMGTMLEKSRLAEDLLHTIGQLFGPIRGGLGLAVVFVGALLAAATGVVGASVVAMGMISLPVMLRYNYQKPLATGVIAAAGTLGQIIPPSIVLVVLADQIGTSVGHLFIGALVPGVLLTVLFAAYVLGWSWISKDAAPALPAAERELSQLKLLRRVCVVLVPPLALVFLVLGSIFSGFATPTEAGAVGATGAMVLALLSGRLTKTALMQTLESTTKLTAMVMMLLVGSQAFTLVFRLFDGNVWIETMFRALPGQLVGALLATHIAVFLLGFFIDFFEICFIVIPLLAPIFINEFGVHPAWFGVMIAMNLQTSFLTPPFGFALFYLKGVCPKEVRTTDIYKGVIPFIAIQVVALVAVIAWPEIVTRPIEWFSAR